MNLILFTTAWRRHMQSSVQRWCLRHDCLMIHVEKPDIE